jgi:serine/threonine-protein kinase
VLKLLDFGLVKSLVPAQGAELTHTDAITGTPQYFAPESILEPARVDARVDLYALGGVAYFLLCGGPAFQGKSVLEICGHHLHTVPEPPSERLGTPVLPELEALVLACLEKDRERRPRDASELHARLLECAKLAPWSRDDATAFWRRFRTDSKRADGVRQEDGQLSGLATDAP